MTDKLLEKHVLLRQRDVADIHQIDVYMANDVFIWPMMAIWP
jgi:hypothetical protein